ncbi:MAG: phage tail sheath C-terminal domain-containing protein [Bacteroidota bacterium]
MPIQPTYPGVYVQEVPSGVRTIVGVSTSVALFVGRAAQGPINQPIQCLSYTDFVRVFSADTSFSDMPHQVKLFFMNGGTNCYIMRIANGASRASVVLEDNIAGLSFLELTAKQHGKLGETIRANVTYNGQQPEQTFNVEIFRVETNAAGQVTIVDQDPPFQNLSMNSNSSNYAPDIISQNSQLVNAAIVGAPPVAPFPNGYSLSGRPFATASLQADLDAVTGANVPTQSQFQISVDGNAYVTVDLSGIDINALAGLAAVATEIDAAIVNAHNLANIPGIAVTVSFETGPTTPAATSLLQITSDSTSENSAVHIIPAAERDVAVALMLGTNQGGSEINATSALRPVPNGLSMVANDYNAPDYVTFADLTQNAFNQIDISYTDPDGNAAVANIPVDLVTTVGGDPMYFSAATPANGNRNGMREKLLLIRDAVNNWQESNPRQFYFRASVYGNRVSIYPTSGNANNAATITAPAELVDLMTSNVRYYSVGASGTNNNFQAPAGAPASDGVAPLLSDYDNAYTIIESQVDLFNLLVLPTDNNPPPGFNHADLFSAASTFCQQQRAFLLMDAPTSWTGSQVAASGVDALRQGLVNDHSAVFYPHLMINDDGRQVPVGPSGAMAGMMARIDSSRGVWKAPAGTEASFRGVSGLRYRFSDAENGVMNPRGINTLRIFPNGIVNWGARTMDGDDDFASEYKYIPVRRTALFIEESLFRGLKWVVFEPNDEPLWAQIRLNVGAFMHNLFRQGAFQGATKKEAYFVKCDSETTTQNDINLGIVNIWVGFAPLKPAEFVILSLQQMTGQVEV